MDVQCNDNFIRRKWEIKDDVVISGMSGRFPKSESVQEFTDNLFNSIDMMTGGNDRFPSGHNNFPHKSGKVQNLHEFDAEFFSIPESDYMDPQLRKLLEVSYEAIIDSGLDIDSLKGSNTGFYYGASLGYETEMAWGEEPLDVPNYRQIYTTLISYVYDLKGPICHFDTACGSSFAALNEAFTAIKSGVCDQALVAGYNICMIPFITLQFRDLQMVSRHGKSRCLDASANGYGRSEGVCCILLQRAPNAKRIYSTVVNCRSNTDGYKDEGISFPSVNLQRQLMYETYKEIQLDPTKVTYVEAHTTGTQAGDPVELKAIHDVFCIDRDVSKPLMIGCLKSNMGHSEAAAGLCATIKANVVFQKGQIPANLHFEKPNPRIEGLMNKTIVPVTSTTPFEGELISLSCFGFGGANVHVILRGHTVRSSIDDYNLTPSKLPRLVNIAGRSVEGVEYIQNYLEKSQNLLTTSFLDLLNVHSKTRKMPNRGFTLIEGQPGVYSFKHFVGNNELDLSQHKRVYLTSTNTMVNIDSSMKELPVFGSTIDRLSSYLKQFDLNLSSFVYGETKASNPLESTVTSMAIQLGIVNVLKSIQLTIDGVLTQSVGSIINLYVKGNLTEQQAILIAYWFGHFVRESDETIVSPSVEVLSSWDSIKSHLPQEIKFVEKTSDNSCIISGPFGKMVDAIVVLKLASITLKWPGQLSDGVMFKNINFLLNPGKNGTLSSFKNCLIKQILTPDDYINITKKLTTTNDFSMVLINLDNQRFCLPASNADNGNAITEYNLSDIGQGSITCDSLFTCLGHLYADQGIDYCLENLYPTVNYPVPVDTLSLHSLIKFDHSVDWKVFKYPEYFNMFKCSTSYNFKVNPANAEDWYLSDHKIDGRILYPATGLLMFAWYIVAKYFGTIVTRLPVEFRDIRLIRATVLPEKDIRFTIQYLPYNGAFTITESGALVASGKVIVHPDIKEAKASCSKLDKQSIENDYLLTNQDIYKELRVRGYDYGPHFQCLASASSSGLHGKVKWQDPSSSQLKATSVIERTQENVFRFLKSWITFTDSALQLVLLSNLKNRDLYIPTGFESIVCDPTKILETVNSYNRSLQAEHQLAGTEPSSEEVKTTSNDNSDDRKGQSIQCPEFEIIHDPVTQTLSTNGVWVKGLLASDTNRRNQSVTLESYDFIPFQETNAVDEMTLRSIESYSSMIFGLIALLKKKVSPFSSINDKEIDYFVDTVDLQKEENSLANYLVSLCRGETMSDEITSKLPNDLLIGANAVLHSNQRFLRPFIITVASHESYGGDVYSSLNVIEMNDSQGFLFDAVKSFLDLQSLGSMTVNYTVVRSKVPDTEVVDRLSGSVNTVVWNMNESPAPSSLAKNDLIIYKLTDGNIDTIINNIDKIQSIMKPNAHLLILTRETSANLINLRSNPFLGNFLKDLIPNTIDSNSLIDKLKDHKWTCLSKRTLSSDSLPLVGLMFKKLPDSINLENHKIIHVNPFEFSWIEGLKSEIKASEDSLIWLVARDASDTSVIGLAKCLSLEPCGRRIRCVALRPGSASIDLSSINFNRAPFDILPAIDCKFNVYDDKLGWGDYCHLEMPSKPEMDAKCLTPLKDAHIQCLIPGDLSSLVWTQFNPTPNPIRNQSLVTINYSALNFKDIMHATGRLPSNLNPDWRTPIEMPTPIGLEYSGVDSNGNRVMGIVAHRALATKVVIGQHDFMWPVPSSWSMEDAATTPVVYATAIYALLIRGVLREGESVLIHAGTGGVGLAAINIALSMNCRVFTTVSSDEKRSFLKELFPSLDETSFAHSRSTSFEEHILRHTDGRGVDAVLNSLSEDKLQASIRCLAPGGRFLEIGKYDMMQNNTVNLGLFDEGRTFHGILLDSFFNSDVLLNGKKAIMENDKQKIDSFMEQGINSGTIKPLPRKVFQMAEVEKAFRFMANGKHIGKVLIKIKDETENDKLSPSTNAHQMPPLTNSPPPSIKSPLFYPNKVYIVVGGFGGFGLELASWLVSKGVRHLVINSRSGPRTSYHKLCIKRLESLGANVILSQHDLTEEGACSSLFDLLSSNPIGGIFNCALVLSDALVTEQSAETYEKVCSSKVKITLNLDQLTRSRGPDYCDYFVVFSSVACGRGNSGQSNYGLANSYMESICQSRFNDGYHGLAIQWGYVGDVGFVVEKLGVKVESIRGTAAQRIHSCFSVLQRALVYPVPVMSSLVRSVDRKAFSSDSGDIIKSISHILGIKDINSLDPTVTLGELGMDSLMAIEVQQVLEKQFNISINSKEIRALTISKLKEFSKQLKNGKSSAETDQSNGDKTMMGAINSLQLQTTITTNLNDLGISDASKSIYYLPPIEGNFDLMRDLIDRVKRPAIGLNWIYDPLSSLTSLESAANHFADYLTKSHSSSDKLNMVGYSFGGLLAYAITYELEKRHLSNGKGPIISKLFLIDSDPETLKQLAVTIVNDYSCNNVKEQEIEFIRGAIHRVFGKVNTDQFVKELDNCADRKERFEKFKSFMITNGLNDQKADTISKLHELTLQKTQMILNYTPKVDLKLTEIIHIRAKSDVAKIKNVISSETKIGSEQFFDGNHHTLIGLNLDAISETVNNFFTNQ